MVLPKIFLTILLKFLNFFPLWILHFFSIFLGFVLFLTPNRLRSTTLINLGLCFPKRTRLNIQKFTLMSLIETSKTLLESGKSWIYYPRKGIDSLVKVEGLAEIHKSLELGLGVIVFTPHLGNIEIIINYLARNFGCTIPYTEIKISAAENIVRKARQSMGATMVKSSTSGVRSLLKTLKKGELVSVACDQVPNEAGGIISNFFGVPALSMSLVANLVNKTNCSCHSVACVREGGSRGFKIFFSKPLLGIGETDLQKGVNLMNIELEKCIMKAPEQYAWEYKKFKHSIFENPYK